MKIGLYYNTLSIACYLLYMVMLTTFMLFDMQIQEHGGDPVFGIGKIAAITIAVAFLCCAKLFIVPGYSLYMPTTVLILYALYWVSTFISLFINGIDGSMLDQVVVIIRHLLPLTTLVITYNFMMNHRKQTWISYVFICMWVVLALNYYRLMLSLTIDDAVHMVVSYYTLFVLPLIMLTSGKRVRALFIFMTMIVLVTSVKRGGIAALGVGLLFYIMVYFFSSKQVKLSTIVLGLSGLIVLSIVFVYIANSDEIQLLERFENMEQDEGSGRFVTWEKTWKMIEESDASEIIIGHGFDTVRRDSQLGWSAHNDILEVLYDYGLVSLVLYLMALVSLVYQIIKSVLKRDEFASTMSMFLVIFIFLSMGSHVIIYAWANIVMMTIAYISVQKKLKTLTIEEQL